MRELSLEARRLLNEVSGSGGDGPSRARRARVKQRLAAQLAASGVALSAAQLAAAASGQASAAVTAAVVAKGALGAGTVGLWLAVGALAGTLVMVPVTLSKNGQTNQAASAPARAQPAARLAAPESVTAFPRVEPTPPAQNENAGVIRIEPQGEVEASPRRDGRPAGAAGLGAVKEADGSSGRSNVGAEAALLESAQHELAAGQGQRALELLDRHQAQFPNAALSEERAFGRVIALCQLGRTAEARASAEAFLRVAPRSPLLPRLRNSCAFSGRSTRGGESL